MKKILFSILFATICFTANAQQFGDWEIVCWDSAGVVTPLQVRISSTNSTGALARTYYRFAAGALAKVVPGTGTIAACGKNESDSIIVQLTTIINLLGGPDTCVVLNNQSTRTQTSTSVTYAANAYNSISVLNVSGTVTVQTGADTATNLPVNTAIDMTAERCRYLTKSVTVNATAGVALIVFIQ